MPNGLNDTEKKSNLEIARETKARKTKESKVLATFSIEPSFKAELEDIFDDLGLTWGAGVRYALKAFMKNNRE